MKTPWVCVALVSAWSTVAVAQPVEEVTSGTITVPAVPSFDISVPDAAHHGVHELRVAGKPVLGTEIKVKGYVTWIYDCVTALAKPGVSKAKTQKIVDDDPTLCERKKFYLGDAKTTSPERALWVVDVPRPPNKLERERLPKDEIAKWPAVPKYAVGDYVILTGTFALASPHSERNSDGLLVFKSIESAKPPTAMITKPGLAAPTVPALVVKAKAAGPVDPTRSKAASEKYAAGLALAAQGKHADAIAAFREAVKQWDGHHLAYYSLGVSLMFGNEWGPASDALARAFELQPDTAMYALMYGYALHNKILDDERKRQKTSDIDASTLNLTKPLQLLTLALKRNPKLWRASYYLGRLYRDARAWRSAAEALSASVAWGPADPGPYVALAELYRNWDYTDAALAVAQAGTTKVKDVSDVWYVVGMAYDDKRKDKDAVAAFTKALDAKPDNAKALYQRGQAYVRLKKSKEARKDLEAFLASSADLPFAKTTANALLITLPKGK